jgi:hypothetical protein
MMTRKSRSSEREIDTLLAEEFARWRFGGLTLGSSDMPVCKHLLACVLVEHVEHCSFSASFVDERKVSVEDLARWAAGWEIEGAQRVHRMRGQWEIRCKALLLSERWYCAILYNKRMSKPRLV